VQLAGSARQGDAITVGANALLQASFIGDEFLCMDMSALSHGIFHHFGVWHTGTRQLMDMFRRG